MKSSELKGKNIALAQVTFTSIKTYHMLAKDGVSVRMFFDKDYRLQHKSYKKTPIFPWSNFHDTYVILTIPARYAEIKNMLVQTCGYSEDRILFLDDILFECTEADIRGEYDWDWFSENLNNLADAYLSDRFRFMQMDKEDKHRLSYKLCIDVTNKCTLNCTHCFASMPYYRTEERENHDIDSIIESLERLLEVTDCITNCEIFGGEPFLHPQLHKLVSFLNKKKAQDKILCADILTNGTLLLADQVVETIKEIPLFWRISISPYGIHSKKQYELFSQLNKEGITYYSRYMTYWQKFGQVTEPWLATEEDTRKKCNECVCKAPHLLNGKLYLCTVLAHFETLRRIPYDDRNSFDCTKPYTKEDLREFLYSYSPGMAYCNGSHQVQLLEKGGGGTNVICWRFNPCSRTNQRYSSL